MKKILLVILLALTLTLSGCGNNDKQKDNKDFAMYHNSGNVDYQLSLRNHDWVEVDSEDGTTRMLCADLISFKVNNSGTLEIIDDDYDVYLISENWQVEFYDYNGE